jgi:hypothetical protein
VPQGKSFEEVSKNKKMPTKIKDLEPGDEDINILAEVFLSLSRSLK